MFRSLALNDLFLFRLCVIPVNRYNTDHVRAVDVSEICLSTHTYIQTIKCNKPAPVTQLVECPLRGTRGHGFDPEPRHTSVVKFGTNCSSLGTQTYGEELGLVDPVSG